MSRTELQITLGLVFVLLISSILVWYGFGEEARMAEFNRQQKAQAIEVGADLFETYCSRCHGLQGLGIQGLCPPLNDRYFFDKRLKDVGWSGAQEDYIVATASGGRLASTRPNLYPGAGTPAMPSFSDRFGGPLRDDQIRSIAGYILNWQSTAKDVSAPPTPAGPPVGTDINVKLPTGDAKAGEALATSAACVACHVLAPTGPAWPAKDGQPGIATRAAERIKAPDYKGKATSAEQYLLESIINPSASLVSGFADGVMPKIYSTTMTAQDVANLIAYLQTLK
jgi:mono/diheme cytochrome c family protein